jgi:hypothetical protein
MLMRPSTMTVVTSAARVQSKGRDRVVGAQVVQAGG